MTRAPAVLGVGAGVLYASFALDLVRRGADSLDHVVSELAAPGEPYAWFYRGCEVGTAVLLVPLLPQVRDALPAGRARDVVTGATGVFAAGAAVAGLVPTPCGPREVRTQVDLRPRSVVHDGASFVSEAGLFLAVAAAWAGTRRAGPRWLHRVVGGLLVVGAASTAVLGYARPSAELRRLGGVSQRVNVVVGSVWLGSLGVLAARSRSAVHSLPYCD